MKRRYRNSSTFDRRIPSRDKLIAWKRAFEERMFWGRRGTTSLSTWIITNTQAKPLSREAIDLAWQRMRANPYGILKVTGLTG